VPSHKVLPSVAHNLAHSINSSLNYGYGNYFGCHLLAASRDTGQDELQCNVLTGEIGPIGLATVEVRQLLARVRSDLERLVVTGGGSMSHVAMASLVIRVTHAQAIWGERPGYFHGRLLAEVTIVDERGKRHIGEHLEEWPCDPTAQDSGASPSLIRRTMVWLRRGIG
jgi:hypothetical protein